MYVDGLDYQESVVGEDEYEVIHTNVKESTHSSKPKNEFKRRHYQEKIKQGKLGYGVPKMGFQ